MTFYRLQKELCGFTGHIGYELCTPILAGRRHKGLEYAKLQAVFACEYM